MTVLNESSGHFREGVWFAGYLPAEWANMSSLEQLILKNNTLLGENRHSTDWLPKPLGLIQVMTYFSTVAMDLHILDVVHSTAHYMLIAFDMQYCYLDSACPLSTHNALICNH
jgi:hypothetical protein